MKFKYKYKREIVFTIIYIGTIINYYSIYDRYFLNSLSIIKFLAMSILLALIFSNPKETYIIQDNQLVIKKRKKSIIISIDDIKLIESSSISKRPRKYTIFLTHHISIKGMFREINGKVVNRENISLASILSSNYSIDIQHRRSGFKREYSVDELYEDI